MVGSSRHGWTIFTAMMILFLAGLSISLYAEYSAHPVFGHLHLMEGKETRFGITNSIVWSTATSSASNGSVNAMHDSLSPIAGMIAMLNIMLGEVIFGVDLRDKNGTIRRIRKGSSEAIRTFMQNNNGYYTQEIQDIVTDLARQGATPLVVADDKRVLGVIHLKDIVKGGIKQRFAELRKMGIRTIMITGDNQLTAAALAAEAGVDDFMSEATPEDKLLRIREEQANGHLVGMIGDGTNDAPAIAISLYSGKSGIGPLSVLNIMNLTSPQSAILSAIIFNAIIIILLVPLALKGVRYKPVSVVGYFI